MKASLKEEVIDMVNSFDVDGDLCDYAYYAHEVFERILEEIILEEALQ